MKKKNPYKARVFSFRKILYDIFRWSGWPLFLWFRVKKIYISEDAKRKIKGGALIISNHILYSDAMVLHCAFWYRRIQFIVMKELFSNKLSSFFYRNCGCIPVDRDKPTLKTFREVVQRLEGGNVITIFPEGHVSFSNNNPMGSFKSGAVLMAHQANVPIIPVYREIRPNIFRRQRIVFGNPINLRKQFGDNIGMDKIEEATKYLFAKELELKELYGKECK